jgi:multiple sugar transport system permease protein
MTALGGRRGLGGVETSGGARGRTRGGGPLGGEGRWALLFLAPTLVGLAILSAGPVLATLAISLTKWDLLKAPQLVGFDNFVQLASDDRFLKALRNTAFYTVVSVPLGMLISLFLALALNQTIRGIAWIRTAYFLPVVTSTIAIALVWQWIYSPDSGLLNQFIGLFGIPPQKWLSNATLAMPSIVAMSVWQGLGTNIIIFLAGLQAIPTDLLDAASVDGAGRWGRFRNVVLPLLTPSIFFTGILSLIGSFQVFDQVFVLSRPRPTEATITVVYFIYENGFKFFKMGYATAASWILFLIVAVLTAIYFRSQNRWVHYQ